MNPAVLSEHRQLLHGELESVTTLPTTFRTPD